MKMRFAFLALITSALFSQTPAKDRTVVLISLDGFPAFAFDDAKLAIPTLRKLAREGAFAPRMQGSNPTVTWPSHTSMITGVPPAKHGVLYNGMAMRQGPNKPPKVEQWRNKTEMVKAPTVYDLAFKAGLTTAEVDWVAIFNAPTVTWSFPELPGIEGKVEKEMIAAGLVTSKEIETFRGANITWRDYIWTEAAAYILAKHRPNLMMYHPLNLDSTHHRYGPRTLASAGGLEYADKLVARLVEAVRTAGMLDRTTFVVVADHGFRTVQKHINTNVKLRENGLISGAGAEIRCDAWAIPEGGTAMLYVTDIAKRAQLVPKLKQMFADVEGIASVHDSADFKTLGMPLPAEYDQMPDIVLAAKPGYAFSGAADGKVITPVAAGTTPGSHGYVASDADMDIFMIAWGNGIKPGTRVGSIRNVDIAPTVARMLGLKMENVEGRVLSEILR